MLKIISITTLLILSILSINTSAQSYFSLGFGGSYGTGIFENSIETFINTKQEGNTFATENKKFTLGGGFGLFGQVQYHIQENLSFGIGFKNHFNNQVEFVEVNGVSGIISTTTRTVSAKRFSIRPSLQVNTAFDKFNTYLQMGVSFNNTHQKLKVLVEIDTLRMPEKWEYTGKSKLGFFATWGVSYHITEHILFKLGLSVEGYQYTPEHNYLREYFINSRKKPLSDKPEIEKSVDFVDWVSDQYNQYPDPDKPLQSPKQTFTYNNLSIELSLNYRF